MKFPHRFSLLFLLHFARSTILLTHFSDAQCPCSALLPDAIKTQILDHEDWATVDLDFTQFFVGGGLHDDPSTCIHGEGECVGQRHFACAQSMSMSMGIKHELSYLDDPTWLNFQQCSYGTCSGCAAIEGPQCPCLTYTNFTDYNNNSIMLNCAAKLQLDWTKLHTCGTSDEGQEVSELCEASEP